MSNSFKQNGLGGELPGEGLTRHWRIGDRDIPWQVASQQSLPPFLPTLVFHPNSTTEINHWTSESCLPKSTAELSCGFYDKVPRQRQGG